MATAPTTPPKATGSDLAAGLATDHVPDLGDAALQRKLEAMIERVAALGRVIVAYSGGVDSTLALKIGTLALGPDCIGVTAKSETLTDTELQAAIELAREHGFIQEFVEYSELEIEGYAANPTDRCYLCKTELYDHLDGLARRFGARAVLDGSNADDVGDYRPGLRAVAEHDVISILREAEVTKDEVRAMARALGLNNWAKPAAPCLSSRVPYGETIDREKLGQIAAGEAFLRGLGFAQVRVRHHGTLARIEVDPAEVSRLAEPELRERVVARLREIGFKSVCVDLAGYRMGSLNEGLK